MTVFIIIWAIVQTALLIGGVVWAVIDKKRQIHRMSPFILIADGVVMIVVFFLVFAPMLENA